MLLNSILIYMYDALLAPEDRIAGIDGVGGPCSTCWIMTWPSRQTGDEAHTTGKLSSGALQCLP